MQAFTRDRHGCSVFRSYRCTGDPLALTSRRSCSTPRSPAGVATQPVHLALYTVLCNSGAMRRPSTVDKQTCGPKPTLKARPLLSPHQSRALENIFKTLANGTRLRMLHALARAGELCVGELATKLDMKPQAVSNQLQRLADRGIVEAQRNGLQIRYSIIDPCVLTLLDQGWCLAEDAQVRSFDKVASVAS